MEKYGSNVVQMPVQRKETAPLFPVPDFDLVVVTARDKERLVGMEINSSNGACHVLLKSAVRQWHFPTRSPSCSSNLSTRAPSW